MGQIKSNIQNNIVNRNNKYMLNQEKVAKVIEVSNNDCYTISVINRDGINSIEYGVALRKSNVSSGSISWEPENGDLVTVEEKNNRFIITDKYEAQKNNTTQYDIYSDNYNGSNKTGNYAGY